MTYIRIHCTCGKVYQMGEGEFTCSCGEILSDKLKVGQKFLVNEKIKLNVFTSQELLK